jgi:sugar phosphate isomerase/epimerase
MSALDVTQPTLSRRSAMLMVCAATATPSWSAQHGRFFGPQRPLGLQLYTMGDVARTALQDTLTRVAALGYKAIELAGLHGHTATELRTAADRAGLSFSSIHVPAQGNGAALALDADIPALAAELHSLGTLRLAMPMFAIPARVAPKNAEESFPAFFARVAAALTNADWWRTAAFLNAKGEALRREGLRLSYHNHNPEFAPLAGNTTGFEILLKETDPKLVEFEIDAGWVAAAGVDPVTLLKKYSGRFSQMHVKDIGTGTKSNFAFQQDPKEVGRGIINWQQILPAARKAGIDQFFVEQEPPFAIDRFEAIAISSKYLLSL